MTQETTVEERVTRTEDRVDLMLENMATRDDVRNMATKDDIRNMATKDDIRNMATKDDIRAVRDEIKILHDRLNILTVVIVVGFIFSIGTFVLTRLIG